jgi:hypothetical protein
MTPHENQELPHNHLLQQSDPHSNHFFGGRGNSPEDPSHRPSICRPDETQCTVDRAYPAVAHASTTRQTCLAESFCVWHSTGFLSTRRAMSDVTQILKQIEAGDSMAASRLMPLVYDELRKLAAARLAAERPDHTLQATALVHEAYLRLVDSEQ